MPNRFENRRSLLLAALLAVLAAGTLCVWSVAAAGLSINSPALEAAIQAFNDTRARDTEVDGSGGGDVNISTPTDGGNGNGGDDTGGNDEPGDTGDGGDTGGNGNGGGSQNCLLGILCLNLDAGIDADVDGEAGDAGAEVSGLTIGGLHIDVNASTDDSLVDVDVDAKATGQDSSRCFLNLICLSARADADLAGNSDLNAVVDVDVNVDDDIDADVDADLGSNAQSAQPNLLDGLLDLFIDVN